MWKENYRIGVEKIDAQHRALFQHITDFLQTIKEEGDWEAKIPKVMETSKFMQSYAIEHFNDEEAFQQSIHYEEYEKHHEIHENFKVDLANLAIKMEESHYSEDTAKEFGGKLMTWLIYHVTMEDQKIGAFVAKNR